MHPPISEFNPYAQALDETQAPPPGGGTDRQAIEFAMGELQDFDALNFLKDWLKGDLVPWPEFTEYIKGHPQ